MELFNPITIDRMAPNTGDVGCPVEKLIFPGDELFLFCGSFFVKSKVTEVSYIFTRPNSIEHGLWFHIYAPGAIEPEQTKVTITGTNFEYETPIGNHHQYTETSYGWPSDDMLIYNIFPWCEFPTGGHAAYVDDDSFFTLDEARARYGRFPKKGKTRRSRGYLHRLDMWLSKQHKVNRVFDKKLEKIRIYV